MSSFSISVKNYAIGAGETLRIQVPGTFFQLMEATDAVDVRLTRAHSVFGDAEDVPLGFSVGPVKDSEAFDGVEIYSATAQTVKVCIARGAVDLRSITQVTGTVQVINGELQRVLNGAAFSTASFQVQVAGEYPHVQLWNPVGSGKTLVLNRATLSNFTGASELSYGVTTSALSTASTTPPQPKLFGSTASVAEARRQSSATLIGTQIGSVGVPSAYSVESIPFSEPVVIREGFGFVARSNAVNQSIIGTFQWLEVVE